MHSVSCASSPDLLKGPMTLQVLVIGSSGFSYTMLITTKRSIVGFVFPFNITTIMHLNIAIVIDLFTIIIIWGGPPRARLSPGRPLPAKRWVQ